MFCDWLIDVLHSSDMYPQRFNQMNDSCNHTKLITFLIGQFYINDPSVPSNIHVILKYVYI